MTDAKSPYLEVAVAAPLQQTLTYAVPVDGSVPGPGQRLLVPLGRRLVTGYLLGFLADKPAGCAIKAVAQVLDAGPLFPESMIPFFRWMARYYHHPIGEVIKGALPAGLSRQSEHRLLLTEAGKKALARLESEQEDIPAWLPDLLEKGRLTPAATKKIRQGKKNRLVEQWQRQGWLEIETVLSEPSVRPKTETCFLAAPHIDSLTTVQSLKPSEQKTLQLLAELNRETARPVARKELTRLYGGAGKALKGLAEKGLVLREERRVFRDPFGEPPLFFAKPANLTGEQQTVLDTVLPALEQNAFAPFLLHGVTGSGKTEVYLRAAEAALAQGRSVLVLVPEIALAAQLEGHFFSRFGDLVALQHSGLSKGERYDQWIRLMQGAAKIAIGARSAIFAPLSDPGLIIVDEEHDSAYKQEDGLRYHARDMALLRGRLHKAVVLLGSATPAVTSYHHARQKKYRLAELTKRVAGRPLPQVEIIDLRAVKTVSGRPPLFTPELTMALRENLAAEKQSLIFLNRRGFASLMLCGDCGRTLQCAHCQVSLTLHKGRHELLCHYCGFTMRSDSVCPHCRSHRLVAVGFGTERLEEELQSLFPRARIARLDRDTTLKRKEFLATLKAVHQREIDILVGTQMITKGHHFPGVTLVGIVWADAGLGIPDFKSAERTFQLLSQVTGRAGRGDEPGKVIIQSYQPEHYSVALAQAHDYHALYEKEIALRRALRFPPFGRLINLRLEGDREESVRSVALGLARKAKQRAGKQIEVLGPSPAPLSKLRGKHRWQLLLKGGEVEALHRLCHRLCQDYAGLPGAGSVKMTLDVDPENML